MREILFRGKRKDNGEWVKGSLLDEIPGELVGIAQYGSCVFRHVDLETVGQFTGLTDKNGKKIFEGDIVQCKRTFLDGKEMIGYINYSDFCLCIKDIKSINNPAVQLCGDFIIIGNIHENPELLENP